MNCIQKVKELIEERGMIKPGSRVLAAVSGGPDSMALLAILGELADQLSFSLATAYFDHRIRERAAQEKALVERHAAALGIPLLLGSGDVPAEARRRRKGIEETARLLRYSFLEGTARKWRASAVALGHTKNDQVETVLHHIIRGAGWRGATGIPFERGIFIRPLLSCSREELKGFLRSRGIRYALDESNRDNKLLRNRIRNRLLPYIRRNFNPSIDESLLRLQENLLEGWETIEHLIERAGVPDKGNDGAVSIPYKRISRLSDFQIYLMIDMILRERFGVIQDVEKNHFDAAKRLIRSGRSGGRVSLPHGVTILKEQSEIRMLREDKNGKDRRPIEETILPGPGDYPLPSWNLSVNIRVSRSGARDRAHVTGKEAALARVTFPVRVRARKPGDRMVPFGMKGRKKLSDLLIDRKVPLHKRERIPVFEDDDGIFWVPGVATDERTRITEGTRRIVRFRLSAADKGKIET